MGKKISSIDIFNQKANIGYLYIRLVGLSVQICCFGRFCVFSLTMIEESKLENLLDLNLEIFFN